MKNKKAFTLIELVSVLVILAILALIVTPLVLNIIRKARTAADKRSIDAYGRSIELAIADYLLENGTFPTSIEQLTIEYSGDQVVCNITQLNSDSSVYLAECIVEGRNVDYTYGKESTVYKSYNVGDIIEYKGINFYVIKNSSEADDSVTLLKAEPLTYEEVNAYGNGHVNRYTYESSGLAYNENGYGGVEYYTSSTCGYTNGSYVDSGCTASYEQSDIKFIVDSWAISKLGNSLEYNARLITLREITSLGYEWYDNGSTNFWKKTESVPNFIYNEDYYYCTMDQLEDSLSYVWIIGKDGSLSHHFVFGGYGSYSDHNTIRPVITIKKSALN